MKDFLKENEIKTEVDRLNNYDLTTPSGQRKAIIEAIQSGGSFSCACAWAMVSEKEVKEWLTDGEDPESKYHTFYLLFKKAEAKVELDHLYKLNESANNGNAAASMWILKHLKPEKYSDKQEVKVDGENLQIKFDIPKK